MKVLLSIRNSLADIAMKFDCSALIDEGSISKEMREKLQKKVRAIYKEIDKKLILPKILNSKKHENRN